MLEEKIRNYIKTQKGNVAVAVKDLKSNMKIRINGDMEFPSASTIKVFIMSELFNKINEGAYKLDDKIEITEEMKTDGDGILKELNCGHKFTIKEICTLMIILSDNMATNILINMLGMDNINSNIKNFGMKINANIINRIIPKTIDCPFFKSIPPSKISYTIIFLEDGFYDLLFFNLFKAFA